MAASDKKEVKTQLRAKSKLEGVLLLRKPDQLRELVLSLGRDACRHPLRHLRNEQKDPELHRIAASLYEELYPTTERAGGVGNIREILKATKTGLTHFSVRPIGGTPECQLKKTIIQDIGDGTPGILITIATAADLVPKAGETPPSG
jgi:hypothetical protein